MTKKAHKRHLMNIEDKEIIQVNKNDTQKPRKSGKSVRIDEVPEFAHKHIRLYRNRINADRGKNYTLKQAYREFVVEKVKEDLKKS
jgi:hypothetical protein